VSCARELFSDSQNYNDLIQIAVVFHRTSSIVIISHG